MMTENFPKIDKYYSNLLNFIIFDQQHLYGYNINFIYNIKNISKVKGF